jgi:hypothetical protein
MNFKCCRTFEGGTSSSSGAALGFADVEILPIENDVWRFYRLV